MRAMSLPLAPRMRRGAAAITAAACVALGCGERGFTSLKARLGDAEAQVELAAAYEHGTGVAKSGAEAVRWYREAAGQGRVDAAAALARIYAAGELVPADPDQAL